MRRLVTLIVGLVGLGLLLLGAPLMLWTVGKDLLPDHVPSLGEIWDALLGPDTGRLFIGALVLIGTIAWVIMAAAIVLEIPAALTGRSMPRIRGLGWAQRTASVLLFMIITGTVTSTMTTAQALPPLPAAPISMAAASPEHPAADRSAAAAPVTHHTAAAASSGVKLLTGRPLPAYTVQAGDTPWSIAEKTLGSGERASEIVTLNTGRTQADGGALTATTFPHPGWVLRLPADARTTDPSTPEPSPSTSPSPASGVSVLVQPGDTLSGIAQRELGDAAAYPELAAVNHLPDPDDILAGSTVVIPANSQPATPAVSAGDRAVQVQPGDTLSGIAQRELGDAAAYPELAAVNHLPDPDIIDAGSTIVIPADQSQQSQPPPAPSMTPPAGTAAAPASPTGDPTTSASSSASAATDASARTADAAPHVAGEQAAVGAGSLSTPSTGESAPTTIPVLSTQPAAAPAEQPPQDGPAAETSSNEEVNAVALIGLSAAAAAALWAGLLAARRRHHRGRRPGRQAPTVDLAAVRTEKRLRERANDVDVAWLDLALRSLGTVLSGHPGPVPDITAAYLGPRGLRLQLAAEQPAPDPFVTDGTTWWLPAAADLPITAAGAVDQMTPLPTLTSIGTLGAETVLVDLERLGSVGLQGDQDACRALITHMAVELAHQSWSDGVTVTLVGWGQELVPLNPDRLTYSGSVQDISRTLESRVREVSAALAGLDTDIVSARARDIAGDSWTPQVLLIDATGVDPADLDALHAQVSALTEAGRVATAVVMTGGPPPAAPVAQAVLTADGKLSVPAILGTEPVAAAALTGSDLDGLLALFANAEGGDVPIPPSVLDEPWATHMDDSGALIPPVVMDEPIQVWAAAQQTADDAAGPEMPPPAAREVSAADLTRLRSVLADDPTLDDDLTEWHSDVVRRPRIAILGPARITAAGETPNRLTWFTQVAVYLALHRDGVTLEKFTADLWPAPGRPGQARAIATSTRNETAFKVRRWMGTHPDTGAPFVPMGTDKYYRLNDRLLDSELLQRLRKRGDAKVAAGDPTAIDDYLTALKLVRGRVLPEASGTGWGWLANADRREDLNLPAMVVDAAHRAVQVALTAGDLDQARWAANLAHDTDPHSDVPLLDLLVIAAQAGDMATANRHAWEVVWANDKEVPEELPTETFQVINRIFPAGLQSVST